MILLDPGDDGNMLDKTIPGFTRRLAAGLSLSWRAPMARHMKRLGEVARNIISDAPRYHWWAGFKTWWRVGVRAHLVRHEQTGEASAFRTMCVWLILACSHLKAHNICGMQMSRANYLGLKNTSAQRPLTITRGRRNLRHLDRRQRSSWTIRPG